MPLIRTGTLDRINNDPMAYKRYDSYRRKGAAARRIQTAYRRYRQPGSTDQRQLRSVLRSHRKANPYQITPNSGRTVSFWRKTEMSLILNQLNGFGLGSNSLSFGFALANLYGYLGGLFTYAPPVPNAAEFQALFDYYMISAVKMQIFFSKTNNDQSSGATLGMPLLLIANDFDDIAENMTLGTMNERVGCRHVQFDANMTNGITHYIKPKPTNAIVESSTSTGIRSTSFTGVTFGSQWIDTAASNIVHNGVKIFYNNQGLTTNSNLGNVTFVFDICYVMKGYR